MNLPQLKDTISGNVITRHDENYETTRRDLLWNGRKPERFPEVIVKAHDVKDVQAAVRFAAAANLQVSVRGGGHHWSTIALQDCVIIDLSAFKALTVDPEARTATAGPAVTNGALAAALAEHGLAFPTGHCASVPLSGYLLGGGFGWNSGAWGVACHNVEAVEVVLADGSVIQASETENADIFWAARGAGPEFFGVVTAYRLRLHPLPRAIQTSVWTYPLDAIASVESWMAATMKAAPRNVEFTAALSSAPPPLSDRADKVVAAVATIFADTVEEAAATLSQLASGAPAGALDSQLAMPTPFDVLYAIIDQFFPVGWRYAADTNWSKTSGVLLQSIAESIKASPSRASFALGVVLPPSDGTPLPDTAFSMVESTFSCIYAVWENPAEDGSNLAWLRGASAAVAPVSTGHYLGEADLDLAGRSRNSFSPAAWSRLATVRAKYDPSGLFYRPDQQSRSDRSGRPAA